jgi:hypothetical protein
MSPEYEVERFSRFWDAYKAEFERLEPESIASYYFLPSIGINGVRSHCFATAEDLRSNFTEVVARMKQIRFKKANFSLSEVKGLKPSLFTMRVVWNLFDDESKPLTTLNNIYTLCDYPGNGMKIVSVIQLD